MGTTTVLTSSRSLRADTAAQFLGIGRSTFWRWVAEREGFPRPRKLSPRCTVFDQTELLAWRDAQQEVKA